MISTQPTTFEELKNLIYSGKLGKANRTFGNQTLYEAYIQFVPKETRDAILEIQKSYNSLKVGTYRSSFTENSFPYDLLLENLPQVKHCLLWHKEWYTNDIEIQDMARIWIKALYGQDLDFCYLVNDPNNRSIKDKPHAHIFINFEYFR